MIEMASALPIQGGMILLAVKKCGHGEGRWNGMREKPEGNLRI